MCLPVICCTILLSYWYILLSFIAKYCKYISNICITINFVIRKTDRICTRGISYQNIWNIWKSSQFVVKIVLSIRYQSIKVDYYKGKGSNEQWRWTFMLNMSKGHKKLDKLVEISNVIFPLFLFPWNHHLFIEIYLWLLIKYLQWTHCNQDN